MLDGNTTSGGWSNRYSKAATKTLLPVTNSRPRDSASPNDPVTGNLKIAELQFPGA